MLDNAVNGELSGGGFVEGPDGTYTVTGDSATVTAAIQALAFDPTENLVAPLLTTRTFFTIEVSDGSLSATDGSTNLLSLSINDLPTAVDDTGADGFVNQ